MQTLAEAMRRGIEYVTRQTGDTFVYLGETYPCLAGNDMENSVVVGENMFNNADVTLTVNVADFSNGLPELGKTLTYNGTVYQILKIQPTMGISAVLYCNKF